VKKYFFLQFCGPSKTSPCLYYGCWGLVDICLHFFCIFWYL